MTDLPRQIPTTVADQEEQMPEWVKDHVLVQYRGLLTVSPKASCWPHALDVWQWCPEPVDPDLAVAAELFREWSNSPARRGQEMILAAIKRGRVLEQGEG